MSTIYGLNPVLEALRARRVLRLFVADGRTIPQLERAALGVDVPLERMSRHRLDAMAEGASHQGVVAEVSIPEEVTLDALAMRGEEANRLVVLLDGIQDPQNLGAIVRSAHCLGAQGIIIPRDRAAPVTPAVMKASAGAAAHLAVCTVTNLSRALETLKSNGYWSVAAVPTGGRLPWEVDFKGPIALVVGSEGGGIRSGVLNHCDFQVRIPVSGAVSALNASVAAGVLLYEVARQRALTSLPPQVKGASPLR